MRESAETPAEKPPVGTSEDLFDFASGGDEAAAPDADEIDIESFLSAVGELDAEDEARSDLSDLSIADDLSTSWIGSSSTKGEADPKEAADPEVQSAEPSRPRRPMQAARTVEHTGGPLLLDLPWTVIAGGAALIALNAWLVFTLWSGQYEAQESLGRARMELEAAADAVAAQIERDADRIARTNAPLVAPVVDGTSTLGHVRHSLELGDYALARRQLYALLSIIDRLAPGRREDIEARASFLLADVDRLEAEARRAEEVAE